MKEDQILFYYRKRVMLIDEEMRRTGYITIKGEKLLLTDFVDALYDKLPEQILNTGDPEFDENVPYIMLHPNNPIVKDNLCKPQKPN